MNSQGPRLTHRSLVYIAKVCWHSEVAGRVKSHSSADTATLATPPVWTQLCQQKSASVSIADLVWGGGVAMPVEECLLPVYAASILEGCVSTAIPARGLGNPQTPQMFCSLPDTHKRVRCHPEEKQLCPLHCPQPRKVPVQRALTWSLSADLRCALVGWSQILARLEPAQSVNGCSGTWQCIGSWGRARGRAGTCVVRRHRDVHG